MYILKENYTLLGIPQVRALIKKDGIASLSSLYAVLYELQKNGGPVLKQEMEVGLGSSLGIEKDYLHKVLKDCSDLGIVSEDDGLLWYGEVFGSPNVVRMLKDKEYIPYEEVVQLWNSTCTRLPKVKTLGEGRKKKMRMRFKEWGVAGGPEEIIGFASAIFSMIASSDFLNGGNPRKWAATFDWVFANDKNYVKVYEGNYNRQKTNKFEELASLCEALQ